MAKKNDGLPESVTTDQPSLRLNPHLEDQSLEIKPTVMGPPAFGSPDPDTAAAMLAPVVDHPRRAAFSDDYGASVEEATNDVSGITGDGSAVGEEGYAGMKVDELKDLARDREIEGFSGMKKDELVSTLTAYDELQANGEADESAAPDEDTENQ